MSFSKGDRPGDKVIDKTKNRVYQDKVVKVKPDGTQVIKTKEGTLKEKKTNKKLDKPLDRPTQY